MEDEGAVAAQFLSVENQADVGVLGAELRQKITIHPATREGESEGDLIVAGDFTHDAAGFDDFGGLVFLGKGVEFGVAAGVCAEDKAFGLHVADLGAGEEGLVGAEVGGDVHLEEGADLIEEGFGGLLVGEEPGGK